MIVDGLDKSPSHDCLFSSSVVALLYMVFSTCTCLSCTWGYVLYFLNSTNDESNKLFLIYVCCMLSFSTSLAVCCHSHLIFTSSTGLLCGYSRTRVVFIPISIHLLSARCDDESYHDKLLLFLPFFFLFDIEHFARVHDVGWVHGTFDTFHE